MQKIALLGLSNAGKTSILKTILYQFEDLEGLMPTKSVKRSQIDFLGREIIVWDFGAQERFLKNYFRSPEKYFQSIEYLYYVVDSQDEDRLIESMSYFLKAYNYISKYSPEAVILLLFHKIDPDYNGYVDFNNIEQKFLERTIPIIQENSVSPPQILHTSIFTPMSIISAFSQPLFGNKSIYLTVSDSIQKICQGEIIRYGILFTKNYFEIGRFYPDSLSNTITSVLKQYLPQMGMRKMEKLTEGYVFEGEHFLVSKIEIEVNNQKFPFYLLLGLDSNILEPRNEIALEKVNKLVSYLQKILKSAEVIRVGQWNEKGLMKSEFFDDY